MYFVFAGVWFGLAAGCHAQEWHNLAACGFIGVGVFVGLGIVRGGEPLEVEDSALGFQEYQPTPIETPALISWPVPLGSERVAYTSRCGRFRVVQEYDGGEWYGCEKETSAQSDWGSEEQARGWCQAQGVKELLNDPRR